MTRTERFAEQLLRPLNPSLILVLGIYTVVWGLWVASPFWSVFTSAPLYTTMAGIGSEYVWGIVAMVVGLVICRGATKPSFNNVQQGSFVGFFFWLIICVLYFMGDWHTTGGISAAAFAIYSGLVWVNTKVNRNSFRE